MKDLKGLADQCRAELEAVGIRCGKVRSWSVNRRAKSRWGQCRQVAEGVFDIEISERLLSDEVEETAAKTTIIHELLHTVEGCMGHRGKWKLLAELVGRAYPWYQIKRTSSCEEKGIPQEGPSGQRSSAEQEDPFRQEAAKRQARYRITCMGCGVQVYRQRASRLIRSPEDFRCGRCGGRLRVEIRKFLQ